MPKIKTLAATLLVGLLGLVACQPQPAKPMSDEQWRATVEFAAAVEDAKWRATVEYAAAVEAARLQALQRPACSNSGHSSCQIAGIEVCNGRDLPTCGIIWRESRFNITARNPNSSAGGYAQMLKAWLKTCGIRGVSNMAYAPLSEQVRCARYAWNGGVNSNGLGPRHWRLTA